MSIWFVIACILVQQVDLEATFAQLFLGLCEEFSVFVSAGVVALSQAL
jgi:hypothetical protein